MKKIFDRVVRIGDPVYVDSFAGLLPAHVARYSRDGRVWVTVDGEEGEEPHRPHSVVPRGNTKRGKYETKIVGTWTFQGLADEHQPGWA